MKFILLILLCSCITFQEVNNKFYEFVLNDFQGNGNYVLVDIKTHSSTKKVVITNINLLTYFYSINVKDIRVYNNIMKEKLINHIPIELNESDLELYHFYEVTPVETVTINSNKGRDTFFDIYFNKNRTLKKGISGKEVLAIIQQLFEWEIPTFRDHETGIFCYRRFKDSPLK